MTTKLETLQLALQTALGEGAAISAALGEVTVVVKAADYIRSMTALRDTPALAFEQMIDLCGVDYSEYGEGTYEGPRFAVVVHLLSLTHNWRVRVRVFCPDDDMPLVESITPIWRAANWFEREAFDLFGFCSMATATCAAS